MLRLIEISHPSEFIQIQLPFNLVQFDFLSNGVLLENRHHINLNFNISIFYLINY